MKTSQKVEESRKMHSGDRSCWWLVLVLWVIGSIGLAGDLTDFEISRPELREIRNIQRTLTLLNKATKENPTDVRIAFCGTPFTNNTWWTNFVNYLETTYPDARIKGEFYGIERHFTEQLIRYAENQLFASGQDLVILQTVGYSLEFQRFVNELRERTSSDIIILTDLPRNEDQLTEPTDPKVIVPNPATFKVSPETWPTWYNNVWLPLHCEEKSLAKADVRAEAKKFLRQQSLRPDALLLGNHQLTELGNRLVLETLKPFFELSPVLPQMDPWDCSVVSTYRVPKDKPWNGNRVTLEATGNRVELVVKTGNRGKLEILVDGSIPSENPDLRVFTSVSSYPNTSWPILLKVRNVAPLVEESWRVLIQNIRTNGDGKLDFDFEVYGSKTGPDGSGRSGIEFLSKSHRVSILPEDWNLLHLFSVLKIALPERLEATWETSFFGLDVLKIEDLPIDRGVATVPVAYGLKSGRHRIEIIADEAGRERLTGIRIYKPSATNPRKRTR